MRLSSDNMHASAAVESSPPELEVPRDPRLGSFEFVEPDSRSMCTCSWLGMSPEARAGWNLIHVKTDVIRIAYMAAVTGTVVTSAVLYGGGFPLITLRVHIPSFLNWLAYLFLVGQILRGGPLASNTNKYKGVVVVYIGSLSYLTVASFVGPIWYTPFKNRLVNVALTAAQLLFMGCSAAFGGTADDIPAKPYQSLWWPFTNSAFTTMRIRDVLTDFGFARILLDQVSRPALSSVLQWFHQMPAAPATTLCLHQAPCAAVWQGRAWHIETGLTSCPTLHNPACGLQFFSLRCVRQLRTYPGWSWPVQGPPCMWFAKPVPCSHYTRLAVAVGVMSLANLLIVWLVLVSGGTMLLFNRTGSWCDLHG